MVVVEVEQEEEKEEEEEENGTREIGSTVSCSAQRGSAQPHIGSSVFRGKKRFFNISPRGSPPIRQSRATSGPNRRERIQAR